MKKILRAASVVALTGMLSAPALAASVEALVKAGKYQEAYQQGLAQQQAREGTPSFDAAFAEAALRSGHPGDALFAYDRLLVLNPNNAEARLGLAEALIALGNHKNAQAELMVAGKQRLSPAQRARLNQLQENAEAQRKQQGKKVNLWIGFDHGHDSNVNEGPFITTWVAGRDGPVTLAARVKQQSAWYNRTSLGGSYVHPLSGDRALDVVGRFEQREALGEEDLDTRSYRLNGGYSVTHKGDVYRVALRLEQDDLDSERFRTVYGIIGERSFTGRYDWNRGWDHKLVTGMARIDFQENETSGRDVDQFLLGLRGTKQIGDIQHSLRSFYIFENAEDEFGPGGRAGNPMHHNGRRIYALGWRGEYLDAASVAPGLLPNMNNLIPFADVGVSYTRHNGALPSDGNHRKQWLYDLSLGMNWHWDKRLRLHAKYQHRQTDANMSLYDIRRHVFEVGVRYDLM